MSWVKLDDGFTDNEKVEAVSDKAFRLHVAALCYCARLLTDGKIPADRPARLLPKVTGRVVDELVRAGLWLTRSDGWEVKDYLLYNPSKAKVLEEREATAERKRRWQQKNGVRNASRDAVPNGRSNAPPDPTRPGPEGATGRVSTHITSAGSPAPTGGEPPAWTDEGKRMLQEALAAVRGTSPRPDTSPTDCPQCGGTGEHEDPDTPGAHILCDCLRQESA